MHLENIPCSVPDALLDTKEAAAYLRLAPITLAKLRNTGFGPLYLRLTPRAIRYRMRDLQQWALEQQHTHTAEYAQES